MSTYNQNKVQSYEGDSAPEAPATNKVTATVTRGAKEKAPTAFRTISEVADELDVPQHVLRFWETKFTQIKPLKRGGGRRYYRPEDVTLLKRIHNLLYTEGYTIKGVQKLLKGQGKAQTVAVEAPAAPQASAPVAAAPRASAAEALLAKVDDVIADQPKGQKAPLSTKQKAILEAMLGDLKDLRDMIRSEEQ
jgi:DNA-binding transcriptional MerR regulator